MSNYFLSREQLVESRTKAINEQRYFSATESFSAKRSRGANYGDITIFLSHKHSDKDILKDVLLMFKNANVNVYIDWMDSDMPVTTSGITASKIKQKINMSKKFILLATEDAIASKWCNWELGYGDAKKYFKDIAILPINNKKYEQFKGSEYLQIYPIIKMKTTLNLNNSVVEFNGSETSLYNWLRQ